MIETTDSILWYNVERFGDAGFAVPNAGNDNTTLNETIHNFVGIIGKNLLNLNRSEDSDLPRPPRITTVLDVHRLYVRMRTLVAARAVPHNEAAHVSTHVSPAEHAFKVFPTPYFRTRNTFMKRWTGIGLQLISELMQHTENRQSTSISVDVGVLIGDYMNLIYFNMATELFNKTREEARDPAFLLTDADFTAYNPSAFWTDTERSEVVPDFDTVFTEDEIRVLAAGIDVSALPATVVPWRGTDKGTPRTSAARGAVAPFPTRTTTGDGVAE
jgi:hypothetical protein